MEGGHNQELQLMHTRSQINDQKVCDTPYFESESKSVKLQLENTEYLLSDTLSDVQVSYYSKQKKSFPIEARWQLNHYCNYIFEEDKKIEK